MAHDHFSRRDTQRTLAAKLEKEGWSSAAANQVAAEASVQVHRAQDKMNGTGSRVRAVRAEGADTSHIVPWDWAKPRP